MKLVIVNVAQEENISRYYNENSLLYTAELKA